MRSKKVGLEDSIDDLNDGQIILVSGFSGSGLPERLLNIVLESGKRHLTLVHSNAGNSLNGIARLLKERRIDKIISSFPNGWKSDVFRDLYKNSLIELECVPQGTLAERIRAGGSGISAFYTRTAAGTDLAFGKETRDINGVEVVLEHAIRGDFALIKAHRADEMGNLTYQFTSRNFGPAMATAANITIAEVDEIVTPGGIHPEYVITPGVYVDRLVLS